MILPNETICRTQKLARSWRKIGKTLLEMFHGLLLSNKEITRVCLFNSYARAPVKRKVSSIHKTIERLISKIYTYKYFDTLFNYERNSLHK